MASALDLTTLLQTAQSGLVSDEVRRSQFEKLDQLRLQDPRAFLLGLAAELANEEKPMDARILAGITLKNNLDAKDEAKREELKQYWLQGDAAFTGQIKSSLLSTLHSKDSKASHAASMGLAKVAAIEVPANRWPELIPTLEANIKNATEPYLKVSTLDAVGLVCEEVANVVDSLPQDYVNQVLTAVVQGMSKEETNPAIKLAATKAMYNALDFARVNFDSENERNYLMQVICEACVFPDQEVQKAAFECLVRVAQTYYETLPKYITDIYNLSVHAAQTGEEEVALQAVEFWATIAEEEIEIQEELAGGEDGTEADSRLECHKFMEQAAPALVPVLLELLKRQEDGQDEDDASWNVAMAAGTCLGLVANCIGDAVVPLVVPFVQGNISRAAAPEDWRAREAATYAFGSIVDGPSIEQLGQLVTDGLGFLLKAMADPSSQVKTTTAWTIGRIFEYLHGDPSKPILGDAAVPLIVETLLASLKDEVHIADKVAYAISRLAMGYGPGGGPTSALSQFFFPLLSGLLEATKRPVPEGSNLHVAAYEAINDLIRASADDTLELVLKLIDAVLETLAGTASMPTATAEARERQIKTQGHLCGTLETIVLRLDEGESSKAALLLKIDEIMQGLLFVLDTRAAASPDRQDCVDDGALMAVGVCSYAMGPSFQAHMDRFWPYLQMALEQHANWHVCKVAVGTLSDVCCNVGMGIAAVCDTLMQLLLTTLQNPEVRRSIKPAILSVFGAIALAIEDHFERYYLPVVSSLQEAMNISFKQSSSQQEDILDYNAELQAGIFEACSGMLHGMMGNRGKLATFVPSMLDFVELVAADGERDEAVTRQAITCLADIALTMPQSGVLIQQKPAAMTLVQECTASSDSKLQELGKIAAERIRLATS